MIAGLRHYKTMIALRRNRQMLIGLHLGERTATMAQVAGPAGQREIHALASCEIPRDDTLPPDEQELELASNLKRLLNDHHFKGRQVVSCLGSEELFVQNVRLPQLPPEEVDKVVRWEAEERLPYSIEDAEIRHLIAGQVRQDTNIKQEVILLACHRGVVNRRISLLQHAGLTPLAVDVEPCAVLRCLHRENADGQSQRRAYLNISEQATTVIFAEDGHILFLKYVNIGGHQFDQAVARHMDMSVKEAATLRMTVTAADTLNTENPVHRSVADAIRDSVESLASEIELCLRYYAVTFRGKPLQSIVVTGSESSPWLAEYLSERLRQSCEMGDPLQKLSGVNESVCERPGRWTTALGLAMKEGRASD
jgi:type IV pilus assembly protein PilM